MRNPERIDDFCDKLKDVWKNVPDWRFGQLICNMFGEMSASGIDPFFPEDDRMIELMTNYFEKSEE